ncbi:restriction endonuclease [Evansella clarkii]|uniref:restriction endonuclease n=1 Tax=Evansella clarkii TaxID=79879 RepID=UPI000997E73E|nr:restriction endonuclease [Evansella clarkii]
MENPWIFLSVFISLLIVAIYSTYRQLKNTKEGSPYAMRPLEVQFSIDKVDKMSGRQFEHFLKTLFEEKGYKATVTKDSGDYGADLILKKRGKKTVVQAKCYSSSIGLSAVQQVVAAVSFYKADEALVITNNYFTKQAKALANANKVTLIDRTKLCNMMDEIYAVSTPRFLRNFFLPIRSGD